MISDHRKNAIRERAIEAINSLGSRFFQVSIVYADLAEAEYAAGLWHSKRDGCLVTFYANDCTNAGGMYVA